jgi:glycine cleavage system H protein
MLGKHPSMSTIPENLRYASTHEWVQIAEGAATVGISDYAQASLGDITFVQLPKPGATLVAGESFGAIESVKAASDLYAPVSGTVTEVNGALEQKPELVNQEPYAGGWMLKLKVSDAKEAERLMDAAGYGKATA